MHEIVRHIGQVRSEMRFYLGRTIPGVSEASTKKTIERLEANIHIYGKRLRLVEEDGMRRQKILRELNRLLHDIKGFKFLSEMNGSKSQLDSKKIPVLNPIEQLSDRLITRPLNN